jgi:hypothetical protein
MVKLDLKCGLSFCTVKLSYKDKCMSINNVILDTGSGESVFKMDEMKVIKGNI